MAKKIKKPYVAPTYQKSTMSKEAKGIQRVENKRLKHEARVEKYRHNTERRNIAKENASTISIVGLVVVLLLGVSIISTLSTGQPKTFQSFLEVLGSVPSVDFGWLHFGELSLNFPDWLAWAEVIIEIVVQLFSVLGFFLAGILQALMFILYFLQWVFL